MVRLLPILLGLLGLISSMIIHFTVEMFYRNRQLINADSQPDSASSWIGFLICPIRSKFRTAAVRFRIAITHLGFIAAAIYLGMSAPRHVEFAWAFPLLVYFAIVLITDLEFKIVFLPISVVGGFLGFVIGYYLHGLNSTLLGGVFGYLIFFLLYKLGERFMQRLARSGAAEGDEVALGFADVYLAGIMGLLLGWPGIVMGLFLGVLLGGVASLVLIIVRKIKGSYSAMQAIAYTPFLILGTCILLLTRGVFQ